MTDKTSETDIAEFTRVYTEPAPRVFLYAARHVAVHDADDVVADTFAIAWRRFRELPDPPLPWLLVTARHTISNLRRSQSRYARASAQANQYARLVTLTEDVELGVVERDSLLTALGELSEREREAVLLVAWDGLSNPDAAHVAGCSTRTFNVRLHRARQRLARSTITDPIDITESTPRVGPSANARIVAQEATS